MPRGTTEHFSPQRPDPRGNSREVPMGGIGASGTRQEREPVSRALTRETRFASEMLSAQRCPDRGFQALPLNGCLVRRGPLGTAVSHVWVSRSDLVAELGRSGARAFPHATGKDRAEESGSLVAAGCFSRSVAAVLYSRRRHSTAAVGLGQVGNTAGGRSALCHGRAWGWRAASLCLRKRKSETHPSLALK